MIADVICSEWRSVYYEHFIAHKLRYLALSLSRFVHLSLYVSLSLALSLPFSCFLSSFGEAGARFALHFRVKVFAMTRTRELVDLLTEVFNWEESNTKSLDCVQINKEDLVEHWEWKVKESEFLITAKVGRWAWTQSWMDWWWEDWLSSRRKQCRHRGLKFISDEWECFGNKWSKELSVSLS